MRRQVRRPARRFGALAFFVSALALAQPALAEEAPRFGDKDKAAIEEIVRDYLVENPEVLIEAFRVLEEREQAASLAETKAAIAKSRAAIYDNPDDYVAGNPKGDVTLVEFFDYTCGHCKRSFEPLMAFVKADGNIRLVLKEFPILGPSALTATKAAIAARKQNRYFEMHQALYRHKGQIDEKAIMDIAEDLDIDTARLRKDMEDPAIAEQVSRQYNLAEVLGIDGTPAFIVGDTLYPGAVDKARLTEMVKTARGS